MKTKKNRLSTFILAYIKSMRLYYSFITGIAGLVGISYYQFLAYSLEHGDSIMPTSLNKLILILAILFFAWGINQIFNDYLGMEEDKINAPDRPMVSGELNPYLAMLLSTVLMVIAFLITWFFLERSAVIPLVLGAALNFLYEYAKGYGIWGNIVFGIMISSCSVFGFMASGESGTHIFSFEHIMLIFYVALVNGLMTYYTYFKDYIGDKEAGKRTLIVILGIERSQKLAFLVSFLPLMVFLILYYGFNVWSFPLNGIFIELAIIATALQIWTGYLYFTNPKGEMTYFSLAMNFRACACTEAAVVALFNPALGVILCLLSYFLIGFLFNFHSNTKG